MHRGPRPGPMWQVVTWSPLSEFDGEEPGSLIPAPFDLPRSKRCRDISTPFAFQKIDRHVRVFDFYCHYAVAEFGALGRAVLL